MNEQDRFWQTPRDLSDYIAQVSADSPIPSTTRGRDCEMQALALLYCDMRDVDPKEATKSRVNIRRKFLGEWSDDQGPFTDDEVQQLRKGVLSLWQRNVDAAGGEEDEAPAG